MYTDKLITARKYFKMAAKNGFPFFFDHPVVVLFEEIVEFHATPK